MSDQRVTIGLCGLTGYGGAIRTLLQGEDAAAEGRTRLAAVFAPDADQHVETCDALAAGGTLICSSYDDLLASDVEAVWLPVPIDLHRPLTEKALAAGKAVMLEKPVAGCIDDHDAINRAALAANRPVAVGFQDICRDDTLPLKRRLLAGEFGTPTRAAVLGIWPRNDVYYGRSSWAGKARRNGAWVLDSPVSNAMGHFVNLALFLLGGRDFEAAPLRGLRGETLRGRPTIEYADTFSVRVHLAGAPDLVVLLTHASGTPVNPRLLIDTDRGTLRVSIEGQTTWEPTGGEPVTLYEVADGRSNMARRFGKLVRGECGDDCAVATLATSRPHSVLISAMAQALPVVAVPDVKVSQHDEGGPYVVEGLGPAMVRAFEARQTLVEIGQLDLPLSTSEIVGLEHYDHFAGLAAG